MQELVASFTALVAALMRSLHTRRDPRRVLDDSWGDRLVPEPAFLAVHEIALAARTAGTLKSDASTARELVDDWLRANAAYPNVIVRSRFTEDALAAAIARGVRQYVLIGAGFDTYSLRREGAEGQVQVFEIDHPVTQSLKIQCILKACGSLPMSTHFVSADLGKESVFEALSRTSFKMDEPVFFSWLGVTMTLSGEANLLSMRAVGAHSAPGSEIVFSYLDQEVFEEARREPTGPFALLLQAVAAVGEPFLSGFEPASLRKTLAAEGLELVEDLDDVQVVSLYDTNGVNRFKARAMGRIARAVVSNGDGSDAYR